MKPDRSEFANVTARAYFKQYVDGNPVMNNPQIYYATLDNKFGSCSTLTPLGETEVNVLTLEIAMFGDDVGDDESALADYIRENNDFWNDVIDAISEFENENPE